MSALLFYLSIALVISFICSLTEAVLLSIPQSYLASIRENQKWAGSLLSYKEDIDKPLSAILSLNTIAHTVGAAGVGVEAAKLFGETSIGLVSAILTILILIFSEIIPKTIGAKYNKTFSSFTLYAIKAMVFVTYPLVLLSNQITNLFSKDKAQVTSRDEIAALANMGYNDGVFSMQENKIIQNILNLKKIKVTEIMTPRVVIVSADENSTLDEFKKNKEFLNFSRIPVYLNDDEKITGYVFLQDILEKITEDKSKNESLTAFKRNILTYPNTVNLFALFNHLIQKKEHIAIIVDEYGGLDGIVTMEDIIETLIGIEIIDEKDQVVDLQKYAKEKWKKKVDNQKRKKSLSI